MLALIFAGGGGTRLDLGEKPLVLIRGKPMIEYVIDAFTAAGHEVVVVLSGKTPFTRNWCRAREITHLTTSGAGYIEDIAEAVGTIGVTGPFFTCRSTLGWNLPSSGRSRPGTGNRGGRPARSGFPVNWPACQDAGHCIPGP